MIIRNPWNSFLFSLFLSLLFFSFRICDVPTCLIIWDWMTAEEDVWEGSGLQVGRNSQNDESRLARCALACLSSVQLRTLQPPKCRVTDACLELFPPYHRYWRLLVPPIHVRLINSRLPFPLPCHWHFPIFQTALIPSGVRQNPPFNLVHSDCWHEGTSIYYEILAGNMYYKFNACAQVSRPVMYVRTASTLTWLMVYSSWIVEQLVAITISDTIKPKENHNLRGESRKWNAIPVSLYKSCVDVSTDDLRRPFFWPGILLLCIV